jgi:hypothetical protein
MTWQAVFENPTGQEQAQKAFSGLVRALRAEGFQDLQVANSGGGVMVLYVTLGHDARGFPTQQILFSEPWQDERGGYGTDLGDNVYEFTYEGWAHAADGYPMWIGVSWEGPLGRDRWQRYARAVRRFVTEVAPRLKLSRKDWEKRYDVTGRRIPDVLESRQLSRRQPGEAKFRAAVKRAELLRAGVGTENWPALDRAISRAENLARWVDESEREVAYALRSKIAAAEAAGSAARQAWRDEERRRLTQQMREQQPVGFEKELALMRGRGK